MKFRNRIPGAILGGALAALALAACTREDTGGAKAPHEEQPASDPSRVGIPATVRRNLGITFATVERRPVQRTVRVPGEFELRPEAIREYRAMLPGRVTLKVRQFERVEKGVLLFSLDSPEWRKIQHAAVEAQGNIKLAEAAQRVAVATREETQHEIEFLADRISALSEAQVRRVELESKLASLRNDMPRLSALVQSADVTLGEAHQHYNSRLNTLASVTGLSAAQLAEETPNPAGGTQSHWRRIERVEVRAEAAGIVDEVTITNGGWIETGGLALTTVDPTAIRFTAHAPQSDMQRFRAGQRVSIVPPQGGSIALQDSIPGILSLGFRGHSEERTVPLYVVPAKLSAWAKPGVSAYLEVFVEGDEEPALAIPRSSVVRDELDLIFFRRNPDNADEAVRIEADLGVDDGRWVVVHSGVMEGDEVVLDGAYALKLVGGKRQAPAGYHYHADGTLHKDE